MKKNPRRSLMPVRSLMLILIITLVALVRPSAAASAEPAALQEPTLWQHCREGGWVMLPLFALSAWEIMTLLWCCFWLRKGYFVPKKTLVSLQAAFSQKDYESAILLCEKRQNPVLKILKQVISHIGCPLTVGEPTIHELVLQEIFPYENKISCFFYLGFIAPMLGFLGTSGGMIRMFQSLGMAGIGDPSKLVMGVGEVLIATTTGLMIGIFSFALHYLLRNRLMKLKWYTQDVVRDLLALTDQMS